MSATVARFFLSNSCRKKKKTFHESDKRLRSPYNIIVCFVTTGYKYKGNQTEIFHCESINSQNCLQAPLIYICGNPEYQLHYMYTILKRVEFEIKQKQQTLLGVDRGNNFLK